MTKACQHKEAAERKSKLEWKWKMDPLLEIGRLFVATLSDFLSSSTGLQTFA